MINVDPVDCSMIAPYIAYSSVSWRSKKIEWFYTTYNFASFKSWKENEKTKFGGSKLTVELRFC